MGNNEKTIAIIAIKLWNRRIQQIYKLLDEIPDENLMNEIVPNKNRGIYILGHLTAIHDQIIPIMGLGERLYPSLDKYFAGVPDKTVADIPKAKDLRMFFKTVNDKLSNHFKDFPTTQWFEKHDSVSDEEFLKEPYRNKLSILISRTSHLSYHFGQLALLKA